MKTLLLVLVWSAAALLPPSSAGALLQRTAGETPAPPGARAELARSKDEKKSEADKRIELNLLGQTDTEAGESRRNENIPFNLVDNNALKELNVRLGTTATIVREFTPDRSWFGAEFGNQPVAPPHVASLPGGAGVPPGVPPASRSKASLYWSHLNSAFSARSFFQVGDVKPARENDYGFTFGAPAWRGAHLLIEGSQQKLRGSVNGNVLVPRADERTPLATDPAVRRLITQWLAAYPAELSNRPDVNARALNTNSPQVIDNDNTTLRLDQARGDNGADRFTLLYQFTSQAVDAFQFVAGQNPDTDTRSHRARITWSRQWSATTLTDITAGFDRIGSLLRPEPNAVGPMISISGLETLGPQGSIPIDRAQNLFRYAGHLRRAAGTHTSTAGFGVLRRQINGFESDAHRGFWSFGADFGADGITNFRLGRPLQHIISVGNVHRGFRNWDLQFYAGDNWRASPNLTLHYALRYQPHLTPHEVNSLNTIPYGCDCNNLAPAFGLAYRLPQRWGVARAGYGVHFGEIFPVTFQQVRFSPPGSVKVVVTAPDLLDPLRMLGSRNLYLLDPELAVPYSHQYNFSWEPDISQAVKLQLGYAGSRQHKLLIMWYLNRAHPMAGIPQTTATINERRPNRDYAEIRWVLNGSQGYFDAARVAVVVPRWRGLSLDAAYWFSKALDLGASYTNTASDSDSRISRSQWEYESHRDMKGPSSFDQTHAFLWRGAYALRGWNVSAVVLMKTGIPFNVVSGSDGPGFGNVDGNGNDRPNLLDPAILGRTLGDPDRSRELLPRSAFSFMQPADPRGNLGRNVFRKGGIRNVNAALARTFAIGPDKRVTFRAESINFFNTPQFAEPGLELTNQNFGQITNTLNEGRTFRFTVQLAW